MFDSGRVRPYSHLVGFNVWFNALTPLLKIAVIVGIIVGSFLVASSFVVSTIRIWKAIAEILAGRKKRQ